MGLSNGNPSLEGGTTMPGKKTSSALDFIKPCKPLAKKKASSHDGWGGVRPGAGRKPLGEKALDKMVVIRLTAEQKAFFRTLGGSVWLRQVLDLCMRESAPGKFRDAANESPFGGIPAEKFFTERN